RCVVVAVDGAVSESELSGAWLGNQLVFDHTVDGRSVFPIRRGDTVLGALVVGPRTDRTPLSGLDLDAITTLARRLATPVEAAILREQAEDEARYRASLSAFARELG